MDSKLRRFIVVASLTAIVLAVAWGWAGKGSVALVVGTVSPTVADGIDIESDGHKIRTTVTAPDARSVDDTPILNRSEIDGRQLSYGLVPAVALILAVPGISRRLRLIFVAGAITLSFLAGVVAVEVLAEKHLDTVVRGGSPLDVYSLSSAVSFLLALLPSIVLVPAAYLGWTRSDNTAAA